MAVVDAELDRTRSGACRTLLIRGDAGTGKSRLLDELLARSNTSGFATVIGRAEDHDRRVAYASLRLAFHDRLTSETSPRLAGTAARLDALLFGFVSPDPTVGTPAMLDLVHEIVTGWADRQPLVLAIDDLHSADPETLEAYAFLARHSSGSRLLLAATVRSRLPELAPDVAAVIDRLRASSSTTVVDLDAMHDHDLVALIRSILGDEPSKRLLEVIEDATDGNPFFTVELVRSLREDDVITSRDGVADLPRSAQLSVPTSAAIAVLHRVFRLGDMARAVARVGAAFTQLTIDQLALVAEMTRLDPQAVEDAFDVLARARILEPSGRGYRFAHGIVRSALYDDLGPAERRRVHAMIAAHLTARRDAGLPIDLVELATHVRCCAEPGDASAAAILLEAGDAVVGVAPRSAVEWYREGLLLLPPHTNEAGGAHLRLGRALSLSSRHDDAAEAAAEAMATLPPGRDWTTAAALRLWALSVSGQALAADRLFEELADLPALRRPRTLAQRAQLLLSLDRLEEAAAAIAEAERVAGGADRVWVEIPRLHVSMSVGDWATGRRVADGLANDLPSLPLLARTSTAISLMNVHSNNGDPRVALDVAAGLEESLLWSSMAAGPISRALARVGRWDDGLAVAADAVAQGGDRGLLYLAWFTIAFVAAERAQPPLDVEVVRAGLGDIELYTATALLCLAYLDVAEGRHERGRAHLAAAWDRDRRSGRCNILPWTLDLKAELDWFAGDAKAAIEASERLDELVDGDAWLVARLSALLTRAVVRADVDAAEHAEQLAAAHELPLELARATAARGALTDDADRLVDAYSRFGALGAARRQRHVSMELRRLGRRVPRGPARRGELSAAERQLAALVAQGFTNREIAERVHLSAKTIEVYLGRIFRKAGCTSRLELGLAVNSGRLELQEQGVPYSKSASRGRSLAEERPGAP